MDWAKMIGMTPDTLTSWEGGCNRRTSSGQPRLEYWTGILTLSIVHIAISTIRARAQQYQTNIPAEVPAERLVNMVMSDLGKRETMLARIMEYVSVPNSVFARPST